MKEKAIITVLAVKQPYEFRHFQVRIPRDAAYICGVEATARQTGKAVPPGVSPNVFVSHRNFLFGDLTLQSCEEGNIFYRGEIRDSDIDTIMSDFSIVPKWRAREWTHGGMMEAETVIVDGDTTVINGLYRDRVGKELSIAGGYEVKVVIWYKINESL